MSLCKFVLKPTFISELKAEDARIYRQHQKQIVPLHHSALMPSSASCSYSSMMDAGHDSLPMVIAHLLGRAIQHVKDEKPSDPPLSLADAWQTINKESFDLTAMAALILFDNAIQWSLDDARGCQVLMGLKKVGCA